MENSPYYNEIKYKPIGIIHSPFKDTYGVPIQSINAKGIEGMIEIFPKYAKGLKDIEGFSHIILIYHFHLCKKFSLEVKPYMNNKLHGIFATRAPARPNPIGISIVHLIKVDKNKLYIEDVDIIDGTPLLDIKPYIPEFDVRETEKIGWLKNNINKISKIRDNGRFIK